MISKVSPNGRNDDECRWTHRPKKNRPEICGFGDSSPVKVPNWVFEELDLRSGHGGGFGERLDRWNWRQLVSKGIDLSPQTVRPQLSYRGGNWRAESCRGGVAGSIDRLTFEGLKLSDRKNTPPSEPRMAWQTQRIPQSSSPGPASSLQFPSPPSVHHVVAFFIPPAGASGRCAGIELHWRSAACCVGGFG